MSDAGRIEKINKAREILNYAAICVMVIFYAGTWTFASFYHITEIYNSLIIFGVLSVLFIANVDIPGRIKEKDPLFFTLVLTLLIAVANLFIIGSHKGCILIIADFLMLLYISPYIRFNDLQMKILEVFFLIMFVSWFFYDREYYFNANTGATVTVFTYFAGLILLLSIAEKKEIYGYLLVISFIRVLTLVLWHLARGAFIALFFFILFSCLTPKKWWKKPLFYRSLILFCTLGSLCFVGMYVYLGSTGFNMKLPFFYKNIFSGREQIWYEVWEILKDQLLTGIGSGRKLRSFFEYNIHNAMYDVLAVHGIIVFAGSLVIILERLFRAVKTVDISDRRRVCALSAIFAIFIESFIDMDLMWADYSPVLLFLFIIVFRNGKRSR